ncbi:MAG: 50S ribosomal protein L24 [Candidatus Colwellbacteria bacterium]|nr:50S ribosomal protein L24 [Candidatus Colwellbacteria bacterium]
MKVKKGDKVLIIKGKDRGKSGKIVRALRAKSLVVIEGLNLRKKTVKPRRGGEKGRIVSIAWPLRAENVMLVCEACGKPTRAGYRQADKKKVRYCKKCKATV